MIYDLNNPLDEENFDLRYHKLKEKRDGAGRRPIVDFTEKCARTLPQNAYLHVILAYFAARYGCSAEDAKKDFFKELVNKDVFVVGYRTDRFTGKRKPILHSSASISKEVMTTCIERFRNWSAKEAEIYIPSADEKVKLAYCEAEIAKAKEYL